MRISSLQGNIQLIQLLTELIGLQSLTLGLPSQWVLLGLITLFD